MKLWVDDLRDPPDESWTVARTSQEALEAVRTKRWATISLDHDLGGEDTTRPVVIEMIESNRWPGEIRVHTSNTPAGFWLVGTCERYAPEGTSVVRVQVAS